MRRKLLPCFWLIWGPSLTNLICLWEFRLLLNLMFRLTRSHGWMEICRMSLFSLMVRRDRSCWGGGILRYISKHLPSNIISARQVPALNSAIQSSSPSYYRTRFFSLLTILFWDNPREQNAPIDCIVDILDHVFFSAGNSGSTSLIIS